jgi:dihydrofolate synthase/folylpolyglutamate synthase
LARAGLAAAPGHVIQVAGSKGKGSTVLWMETLLAGRGERSVAYLSPHLERIEERIRLGATVPPETLLAAISRLHPSVIALDGDAPGLRPTFFDLLTAASVAVAAESKVPWLLLEVGMGGPLDSTTAVPHDVGALATIDLEHRAQLGPTLTAIAGEKARIARAWRPFLIAADPGQDPAARDAAAAVAADRGARVRLVDIDPRVPPSVGDPQRSNLSLAIAALECAGAPPFRETEIAGAAERIELPARLEVLAGPPELLLDGAHTNRSVARFAERLRSYRRGRDAALLVGAMADKEWRDALAPLLRERGVAWIVTEVPGPRGADPAEIVRYLAEGGQEGVVRPLEGAVEELRSLSPRALAVTGSMRLAGEIRKRWIRI